ncbi:MAG: RND transporter, partial [Candidatus Dechloromonas phosphoritropha]
MPARNIRPAKIGLFSVLTVTVALTGCAVGPDYQRPEATLPATYSQAPTDESATAPVNPDWWTLFGDADLNALVQQALAANQDLQAAVARLEAADAFAREVGAAYYPAVGLDAATS